MTYAPKQLLTPSQVKALADKLKADCEDILSQAVVTRASDAAWSRRELVEKK